MNPQADIISAISSVQSGECPVPDRFTAELFTTFSSLLSPQLRLVLSESFRLGYLPHSFADAFITLFAKKGKDPSDCALYRPISLFKQGCSNFSHGTSLQIREGPP